MHYKLLNVETRKASKQFANIFQYVGGLDVFNFIENVLFENSGVPQPGKIKHRSCEKIKKLVKRGGKNIGSLFPAGLEPATFRVLGGRDNNYTTCLRQIIRLKSSQRKETSKMNILPRTNKTSKTNNSSTKNKRVGPITVKRSIMLILYEVK